MVSARSRFWLAVGCCIGGACSSERSRTTDGAPDTAAASAGRVAPAQPTPAAEPTIPVLVAVRTARHGGFDRTVFEFRGDTWPAVRVRADTAPVACGSGDPVRLEGRAFLSIAFEPAYAHAFDGERAYSSVAQRELKPDLATVHELRLTCDFEAVVEWALGLDARRTYVVDSLTAPPRIVLDVLLRGPAGQAPDDRRQH